MPIKSLKKTLYILIAAILVEAGVIALDYHFRHRVNLSEVTHHAILDSKRAFLETMAEETRALEQAGDGRTLVRHYQTLGTTAQSLEQALDPDIFDRRYHLVVQLTDLVLERQRLHDHLNGLLPSLTSSVRYIHEHHIAYLKNSLSRGKTDQDYDTEKDFARSPVRSAPELDIIQAAVAIQTSMLDIFETFAKLEHGIPPTAISMEFDERIHTFYRMINTLEDYSLDAQDGLLVEELLLNGRTFENSFTRFLDIEHRILQLSTEKETNQALIMGQLNTAKEDIETAYHKLKKQIANLQKFSLLVNVFILAFLLFSARRMIRAFRQTIGETKRIQNDLTYQIPVRPSDFIEFQTIYTALNAMADTINRQVVKLEESRNLLEDRVAERTSELSQLNQKLLAEIQDRIAHEEKRQELEIKLSRAEKMEAIGTLAGGVAHDLNNILSGIISYPELILMDLPPDHPLRDSVMTIKSSGEKAAAIVQDLLTLARRGIPVHDPVDLNTLVSQFVDSPECKKILFYHPAVRIQTRFASDLGLINGSQVHLSKTIMNLVSNAAEAMPDGGVIDITTAQAYIDDTVCGYDDVNEGEYLKLKVSDTGEGIAPEDMEKIFEPFFTKKQMGRSGTGLGMAVVWGTVKDHHGYIDVESTPGKGTTFTLYFPMSRNGHLPEVDKTIPPEQYRGRGERVLVIDDVKEQRDIATQILLRLGYEVTHVPSGEAAVSYLQNHPADILLLDMIMPPGIDGLATYRRIIAQSPGQKAVIASGFSENKSVAEAQRLGAGPYIKKPYSFEQLGLVVREELDRPSHPASS